MIGYIFLKNDIDADVYFLYDAVITFTTKTEAKFPFGVVLGISCCGFLLLGIIYHYLPCSALSTTQNGEAEALSKRVGLEDLGILSDKSQSKEMGISSDYVYHGDMGVLNKAMHAVTQEKMESWKVSFLLLAIIEFQSQSWKIKID